MFLKEAESILPKSDFLYERYNAKEIQRRGEFQGKTNKRYQKKKF